MPTFIFPYLGAFLVAFGSFAAWDLVSKGSESVVWRYCRALVALGRYALAAIAFILMLLCSLIALPLRMTQNAMNKPLKERIDSLEQRLDSQDTILQSRQVAAGTSAFDHPRKDQRSGAKEGERE